MAPSAAETKMCSSSVAPMPLMIRRPVRSCQDRQVAAGRFSPAETHRLRLVRSYASSSSSIARYAVGAVNSTDTRCSAMAGNSCLGPACSSSRALAPARIGKTTSPPRPKVKPSGGLPAKRSSGRGPSTCAEKVSAMASTSRWKCMQPLGRPVVPEVNAISATSSAAVSAAGNGVPGAAPVRVPPSAPARVPPSARADRSSGASPPYVAIRSPGTSALARSSTARTSHSACRTRAISQIARNSCGRCWASTVTATAPAFSTASQQAASQGVVGPRSSTRLPGTTPRSPVRRWARRSTRARNRPYVQSSPDGVRKTGRSSGGPVSSSAAQFSRGG